MKKFLVIPFAAFFILYNSPVFSQGVKIGLGGGLTLIQGPDAYTNDIGLTDGGAGFSSEYHLGGKVKVSLPLLPLSPYGHITYHKFSGEASTDFGDIETSQSLLSIGLGAEWSFVPGPVSPYFGLEIAFNNFNDFEITAPILAGGNSSTGGDSRFGGAIGIGTEITLIPMLNLDISAKYNWFNLIGKEDEEETVSAATINLLVLFSTL